MDDTFTCIMCDKDFPDEQRVSLGEEDACPACAKTEMDECAAVQAEFESAPRTWTLRPHETITGSPPKDMEFVTTDGAWVLYSLDTFEVWQAIKQPCGSATAGVYDGPADVGIPNNLIAAYDLFQQFKARAESAEGKIKLREYREQWSATPSVKGGEK